MYHEGSHKRVGYARSIVSAPSEQVRRLEKAGYRPIFADFARTHRVAAAGWSQLLAEIESGDTVAVVELSRLAGTIENILDRVMDLHARNVRLVTLREEIDTAVTGELPVVAAHLRQAQTALFSERQALTRVRLLRCGLGGRPQIPVEKLEEARVLYRGGYTARDAAAAVGIGRRTLFAYLARIRKEEE